MQTSRTGPQGARRQKQSHGSCWLLQAAAFARLIGDDGVVRECRDRFKSTIVPTQIAPDGSFPLELARTKPYGYSLFDLDALGMLAHVLSTGPDNRSRTTLCPMDAALPTVFTSWLHSSRTNNRGLIAMTSNISTICRCASQPAICRTGISQAGYIDLWTRLDPDSTVPEVIRNHPISGSPCCGSHKD